MKGKGYLLLLAFSCLCYLRAVDTVHLRQEDVPPRQDECVWSPGISFEDYLHCLKGRRTKRDYVDPFSAESRPCVDYITLNQPERRITNRIDALTENALCDRAMHRQWYRFVSVAGGEMPTTCVEEYSCGTHAPVWLNGHHPQREGEIGDVEVCLSLLGNCCNRRWYIRVANCGDFYTYLLMDTPGCFMAYCVGNELPCPAGQSSPTGFYPGCTGDFPHLEGNALLDVGQEGEEVVFYCDYQGSVPRLSDIEVNWYVIDPGVSAALADLMPVYVEYMEERRRSTLTEGHWMGKVGASVWCRMRAIWKTRRGVPSPWVDSDKYFAGLEVLTRSVNVSEASDEEAMIEFRSTLPITCLPQFRDVCKLSVQVAHDARYQAKRCIDGKVRQVVFGDCSVDITPDRWRETHMVKVKAVRDFYHDGDKRMLVDFKPAYSTMLSHFWNNYQLPKVEVISSDAPTKLCAATGDPHYTTFDGLYYHVYLEGEFVLYKNTKYPIQINTRLERCGQSVSCNCGVAVKVADDVIVIDRCQRRHRNLAFGENFPEGWNTIHRHALEQGDGFVEGLRIYEYDGGKRFTIHMPTGSYLEFSIGAENQWINLYLHASSDDFENSLGLCGTFDNDKSNDFTLPDGVTRLPPREREACGDSPDVCRFANAWRVAERDSYFGETVEVELNPYDFDANRKRYCKCEQQGEETVVVCNYNYDVDNCQAREEQARGVDRTPELLVRSRKRRSADLHDEDDDYFNSVFIYDEDFVGQEPNWPTPGGITENQARRYCTEFVESSAVWQVCRDLLRDKLVTIVDACMIDIKVTDNLDWAMSSLTSAASECSQSIHNEASLWGVDPNDLGEDAPDDVIRPITTSSPQLSTSPPVETTPAPPVPTMADYLLRQVCPSGCSKHGDCIGGKCNCSEGYLGDDCSQRVTTVPTVSHLSNGGLCDIQRKACRVVRVYGSNFRNTTSLKCHFREVEQRQRTDEEERQPRETSAIFDTFEEVICPLPADRIIRGEGALDVTTHRTFTVTVSNEDGHETQPLLLVVFDSVCRACSNWGQTSSCISKEGSCEVAHRCYAEGDKDPDNCCDVCKPSISNTSFTRNDENRRPKFIPWRSTYEVEHGRPWEIYVSGTDPEGCDVTITIDDNNNNRKRSLEATQINENEVKLKLTSNSIGEFSSTLKATDECSGTYSQNFHVRVKRQPNN